MREKRNGVSAYSLSSVLFHDETEARERLTSSTRPRRSPYADTPTRFPLEVIFDRA
jgi:hypothetical protein